MSNYWDNCDHEWKEAEGYHSNEYSIEVKCKKCNVPGEQDRKTGDVFWPAT